MSDTSYDVIIVGGGHNGLTAAAYLSKAGLSVLLLERQDELGGASVSTETFPGTGARLSRYSYLVSLMPQQIIDDLGLRITLARRRYSSYTPKPDSDVGLLVDNLDDTATAESFARVGAGGDVEGWNDLYARTHRLAAALWPTVTEPLATRSQVRELIGDDSIVTDFLERPLGEVIERTLQDDLVRGVAMTDGLISTFASARQEDLQQNICFLYHVIGGGTGAWDVPVGGMGEVSGALEAAARAGGATLETGAEVIAVVDGKVTWRTGKSPHEVLSRPSLGTSRGPRQASRKETSARAQHVLWAAAPGVLDRLMNRAPAPAEGSQVKINLLLDRLPELLDTHVAPQAAFGGTFHINETYTQLETAYHTALSGNIPSPAPAEIYCHSITDPSILPPDLHASGAHTLTVFSLQTPDRLLHERNPEQARADMERGVLDSLSSVLAEPIEDAIMRDQDGRLCIETKTTQDLEETLRMPGGSIFHGPLSWPFVEDGDDLSTPAARWGVQSPYDGILIAGAGSRRGGGVSGLGGYHAAQAVLDMRSK